MTTSDKNTVVTQGFVDKLIDKIGKILKEQHALVERDEEQAEEIESLLEKVSSIENNFEELTKSLAKGSYPLKLARSIKVASSSIKPHIVPVDLTKAQLIATYNELVAVLSGYIIPVTLTPDSYRGSNSDGIILETTVKGNYWAIATLENKQHQYWLVPNNNISFNIHKLKTIENLFQLEGDYNSPESEFILQEPAILFLLPNNKQWKLIQPGVLFFGSNLQSTSPQSKPLENAADDKQSKINKQILSSLTTFETTIVQLTNKITQLEIKSELSEKTYQRDKQEWLSEKKILNEQIKKNYVLQSQLNNLINQSDRTENFNSDNSVQQHPKIDLKTKISQFRQDYTQDIKLISDRIVAKVAISVETLAKITFYKPDVMILENTPHGKYWIIDYLGAYFLIPSDIDQITNAIETSLTVAKILFDLVGYYPQYSSYHLIKPAIVTKLSANQWKLQEKGKFNFS